MTVKGKTNPKTMDRKKINRTLDMIRHGSYLKPAVQANGLNYNTFRDWIKKGKKAYNLEQDNVYSKLYLEVEEAKAQAEVAHVETIYDSAMQGNIGASQWYLSRTHPDRWGKTDRIDVKQDSKQEIVFKKYSEVDKEE